MDRRLADAGNRLVAGIQSQQRIGHIMTPTTLEVGYCTNVHAGASLEQVQQNLEIYTLRVKEQLASTGSLGIGLWLSQQVCHSLGHPNKLVSFADWLQANGLVPITLNGFPCGDFHQAEVKTKVYRPSWAERERLEYTIALAQIQAALLTEESFGTISTLPLGWRAFGANKDFLLTCRNYLIEAAERLERIHQSTGRHIFLAIEPEPGCVIETSQDLVRFFEQHLLNDSSIDSRIRKYLGVCHDVCHSAVMFEPQVQALRNYADREIRVGKVQISSAVEARFGEMTPTEQGGVRVALESFVEPRYLHQTVVSSSVSKDHRFYPDLPAALAQHSSTVNQIWRVHFHVPIHLHEIGPLHTTSVEIDDCLSQVCVRNEVVHFEVETYAWSVLPLAMRPQSLVQGIVEELQFLRCRMKSY